VINATLANGKAYVPLPWLLGFLTVLVMGLTGAWARALQQDVGELKKQASVMVADHDQLQRIEQKLDELTALFLRAK
jgi:hypothetical protein